MTQTTNLENQETDQSESQPQTPDKTMYTVDVFMVGSIVTSVDVLAANEEAAKGMATDLLTFEVKKYTQNKNGIPAVEES